MIAIPFFYYVTAMLAALQLFVYKVIQLPCSFYPPEVLYFCQIFPLFIPEMPAGFKFYIEHVIFIYFPLDAATTAILLISFNLINFSILRTIANSSSIRNNL
jgi:hypothetical protein